MLGTRQPTLAAKSTPSAAVGVAGLRGLNDGQVPAAAAGGGRGGGRGAGPARRRPPTRPCSRGPASRGETQWVQYTFPDREEISRSRSSGSAAGSAAAPARPPRRESWRVLYQDGSEWKPVTRRAPYGVEANTFSTRRVRAGARRWRCGSRRRWRRTRPSASPSGASAPTRTLVAVDRPDGARRRSRSHGDALEWTITLANDGTRPVEIGDLAVPFNFAERTGARGDIYTRKLLRHSFVAGHGSWIYWQRSNGDGPYLVMTPSGADEVRVSRTATAPAPASARSRRTSTPRPRPRRRPRPAASWRLPVTSLTLAPKGAAGLERDLHVPVPVGARFRRRPRRAARRGQVRHHGRARAWWCRPICRRCSRCARRTTIAAIEAEHPARDADRARSARSADGTRVYRVRFSRLGENMLRGPLRQRASGRTLEFFVTEPLETVIQKRAAFLVSHAPAQGSRQVVRRRLQRLGSEERDPAQPRRSRRPVGLADRRQRRCRQRAAGVHRVEERVPAGPDRDREPRALHQQVPLGRHADDGQGEVSLRHLRHPELQANRESADEGRNGRAHVWRIYDYPHIVMLYHRMYQIAKFYPDKIKHLDARDVPRARLSHRGRLLDRADGGREVVGRRRRHDERGVHPRADRDARARGQEPTGRARCAATGKARSIASSTGRRTCTARSSRSTRPASSRPARLRSTR